MGFTARESNGMGGEMTRQLAAPPSHNPLGRDVFQIIERIYRPSLTPGKPPVLFQVIEGPWRAF